MNCHTASIVSHCLRERIGGNAPGGERGEEFAVRCERIARDFAAAVGDDVEAALGDDPRVELLERAGRGVARIGERLLAGLDDGSVHALELGGRHVDFAADFEHVAGSGISCARGA